MNDITDFVTSNVVGVVKNNGLYTARIKDGDKQHTKSFSIKKYGEENAKQMAVDFRAFMLEEFHKGNRSGFVNIATHEKNKPKLKEFDDEGQLIRIECRGPICNGKMVDISDYSKNDRNGKPCFGTYCKPCFQLIRKGLGKDDILKDDILEDDILEDDINDLSNEKNK